MNSQNIARLIDAANARGDYTNVDDILMSLPDSPLNRPSLWKRFLAWIFRLTPPKNNSV